MSDDIKSSAETSLLLPLIFALQDMHDERSYDNFNTWKALQSSPALWLQQ